MAIPIDKLTELDYEMMQYISKHDTISQDQIAKRFPKVKSLEYRLSQLAKNDFGVRAPLPDSSYVVEVKPYGKDEGTGTFYISPLGKKVLEDYGLKNKSNNKKLWKENAWIPITVALVTTLITNWLLPMLPLIIEWFVGLF